MDLNTKLNGDVEHRFENYVTDQPEETSKYQAARELIDEGLRRQGYHPQESQPAGRLQRFVDHLATGFAIAGLILTGMSFSGSAGIQSYTVVVMVLGITLYAANRVAGDRLNDIQLFGSGNGGDSV